MVGDNVDINENENKAIEVQVNQEQVIKVLGLQGVVNVNLLIKINVYLGQELINQEHQETNKVHWNREKLINIYYKEQRNFINKINIEKQRELTVLDIDYLNIYY